MLEIESYLSPEELSKLTRHKCAMCGACCSWGGWVVLYPSDIGVMVKSCV